MVEGPGVLTLHRKEASYCMGLLNHIHDKSCGGSRDQCGLRSSGRFCCKYRNSFAVFFSVLQIASFRLLIWQSIDLYVKQVKLLFLFGGCKTQARIFPIEKPMMLL